MSSTSCPVTRGPPKCTCEVVLLNFENGTADIRRMRGEERLDIPPIDRSSPFVTPVAANRIGASQISPVEPGCAVVLEVRAMVSGRRPERVQLGKVRVASGHQSAVAFARLAEPHLARNDHLAHVLTQGDFVPGEHLSQVRQVLLVASRRGRRSHAKLAHDQRLQQRCNRRPESVKAEPELELHERTKLLVETAERLHCRTPHDEAQAARSQGPPGRRRRPGRAGSKQHDRVRRASAPRRRGRAPRRRRPRANARAHRWRKVDGSTNPAGTIARSSPAHERTA